MAALWKLHVSEKALETRQGPVITQVITSPSTTFTAYVTLGGPPQTLPPTTATIAAAPPVSSTTQAVAPAGASGSAGLSQGDIGAILGSIVAFVVIVLILW